MFHKPLCFKLINPLTVARRCGQQGAGTVQGGHVRGVEPT